MLLGKTLCPGFKVLSFGNFLYLLFPDALKSFAAMGYFKLNVHLEIFMAYTGRVHESAAHMKTSL